MGWEPPMSGGALPVGGSAPQQDNTAPAPVPVGGPASVSMHSQALAALVQKMLQRMAPQRHLPQMQPGAGYGPRDLAQGDYIGGVQGSKMGEIGAGLANIGTAVHNAVAQQKEKQVRTAMADWSTLQQRWDDALAVAGGDEQKAQQIFEADPYTQAVLGDPKKMKNIAKAFSVDYLKPEKTTVYGEALKRHGQVTKAKGMMDTVKKVMTLGRAGRTPQPQLTDEQRQKMAHEMASRLPFAHAQADPQKTAEFLEKMREFDTRDKEAMARIAETHERTQELIRHNQELEAEARARIADAKLSAADRKAATAEANALRQQTLELKKLQVMLSAAND